MTTSTGGQDEQEGSGGALLRVLDADEVPTPAGLAERVMHAVRRTAAPGALLDLTARQDRPVVTVGRVQVRTQVLADIARAAAAKVPGVHVVTSAVGSGADGLAVSLDLVIEPQVALGRLQPLPDVAVAVRRSVRRALSHTTGVTRLTVGLRAVDLLAPQLPPPDGV